jgi:hypothetical protein
MIEVRTHLPTYDANDIGETYRISRPHGVLWISYIKLDGWRYVYVPHTGDMPLTDGGYDTPHNALVEWADGDARREFPYGAAIAAVGQSGDALSGGEEQRVL